MINLTNQVLMDGEYSLLDKFWMLSQPVSYYAENMGDFLENSAQIKIPFHQKFSSFFDKSVYEAQILVHDVRIRQTEYSELFIVYDKAGRKIMYLNNSENKAGEVLTDNNLVDVLFDYFLDSDLCFILAVAKNKPKIYPRRRKPIKKDSEPIPIFEPIIQPAY